MVLVVTPVHKSAQCREQGRQSVCKSADIRHYLLLSSGSRVHMCEPRGRYCINRQLLCDGRVNCVGDSGGNTGEIKTDCVWDDMILNVLSL